MFQFSEIFAIHRLIVVGYGILPIHSARMQIYSKLTTPPPYRGLIRESPADNVTNTRTHKKHSTYKQPRIISNIPRGNNRDRANNNHHAHMHIMPQNHSPNNRSNKIPVPKLRRNNHMALLKMPKIRKTIPLPKMRIFGSLGTFGGLFTLARAKTRFPRFPI